MTSRLGQEAVRQGAKPVEQGSDNEGWVEVTPRFITFDKPGDSVQGRLVGTEEVEVGGRIVHRATVVTEEGVGQFLLTTQIESVILSLEPGLEIRVIYDGSTKNARGQQLKQFRVFTRASRS